MTTNLPRPGSGRTVVLASMAVLAALCWAGMLRYGAALAPPAMKVAGGATASLAPAAPYGAQELAIALAMWVLSAWAALLPSAIPAVLLFARISLLHRAVRKPWRGVALFVGGYLAAWSLFGVLMALAQWILHDGGALDAALALSHPAVAGLLLVAAGVYQWMPSKHSCLHHCREPMPFMLTGWEPGPWGAAMMGATHGVNCIGACGLLVLLLFAAGVGNLAALAALAALVLAEKLLPAGPLAAWLAGLALVAWGTLLLFP